MALNGSQHNQPGSLVESLQRLGMKFGAAPNASTGFNRTVYLLELPETDKATLAENLRVFGDHAAGLSLLDREIKKSAVSFSARNAPAIRSDAASLMPG
jgi:zinc protease